jgi:hypothetical protein
MAAAFSMSESVLEARASTVCNCDESLFTSAREATPLIFYFRHEEIGELWYT